MKTKILNIGNAMNIQGYMGNSELTWLADFASRSDRILEIGCYKGRSTRALGDNTDGIVLAIDPWDCEIINLNGQTSFIVNEQIYQEFLDNLHDLIGKKVLPYRMKFEGLEIHDKFDLIFIDGEHRYEQVVQDINQALRLLDRGGIISGHDYNDIHWPDVAKAVDELLGDVNVHERIWWKKIGEK